MGALGDRDPEMGLRTGSFLEAGSRRFRCWHHAASEFKDSKRQS